MQRLWRDAEVLCGFAGGHEKLGLNAALRPGVRPQKRHPCQQHPLDTGDQALCDIHGQSVSKRFFVLDEAQQLTPLEAKTVATLISRGSKVVMVGDPDPIDNPDVDCRSNGLVYTRDRLRQEVLKARIWPSKSERSPLAEIGASRM